MCKIRNGLLSVHEPYAQVVNRLCQTPLELQFSNSHIAVFSHFVRLSQGQRALIRQTFKHHDTDKHGSIEVIVYKTKSGNAVIEIKGDIFTEYIAYCLTQFTQSQVKTLNHISAKVQSLFKSAHAIKSFNALYSNRDVFTAWLAGVTKASKNIITDGSAIYSHGYHYVLATNAKRHPQINSRWYRIADCDNKLKYSTSTYVYQIVPLEKFLNRHGLKYGKADLYF